jgi:hypothetical protein
MKRYYEFHLPEGHYIMVQEGFLRNLMVRLGLTELNIAANLNSKSFTLGDYKVVLVTRHVGE